VPETPEELWERVEDDLRMAPVEDWETFPFSGSMSPRPLAPPVERERPGDGEDAFDWRRCTATDDEYLWTTENWRLRPADRPTGLPVIVLLEPREHVAEPGDNLDAVRAALG